MPLNWLGTLEQRPSPLTQALAALQPASEQIRDWLAKRPEIERQMAVNFVNAVTQMPPNEQKAFLARAKNLDSMLSLVDKYVGPGLYRRNDDGTVEFMVTPQVSQASTEAQKAEFDLETQKAMNLLTPLIGMTTEEFSTYRTTSEGQARLHQIAQSPLANYVRTLEDGSLTLVSNAREMLERQQAMATIQKTTGEAKLATAEAGKAEAETTRINLLMGEELNALVEDRKLTAAQRTQIETLLPAQLDNLLKDADVKSATAEQIRALIEPTVQKLLAEAGVQDATRKEILDLLPEKIKNLQADTAVKEEQVSSMRAEREAFVAEWQAKSPYLAKTAELQFKLLEQQLEAGEVSIEQARAQTERIKKDIEEADARITDMVERRGIDKKFIEAQIEKIQAETKEIETTMSAKQQLMLAEAEWYKKQGVHLTNQDALAWAAFEHQASIDDVDLALRFMTYDLEKQKFEWTKQFESEKFKQSVQLERDRLAVERDTAAAQKRLWAAQEAVLKADSETERMKAVADMFATAIAASESAYYMIFPAAKPGTPPGTVPPIEALTAGRNTLVTFLTSALGKDAIAQIEAATGLDIGSLADACLGGITGAAARQAQQSQPAKAAQPVASQASTLLTEQEASRYQELMKIPAAQMMAQQLFKSDDSPELRREKMRFVISVMDVTTRGYGMYIPSDITTNPARYFRTSTTGGK